MNGCRARIVDQDETYNCGKPTVGGSTRCAEHLDRGVEHLSKRSEELMRSIAKDQAELGLVNVELQGLQTAVSARQYRKALDVVEAARGLKTRDLAALIVGHIHSKSAMPNVSQDELHKLVDSVTDLISGRKD